MFSLQLYSLIITIIVCHMLYGIYNTYVKLTLKQMKGFSRK